MEQAQYYEISAAKNNVIKFYYELTKKYKDYNIFKFAQFFIGIEKATEFYKKKNLINGSLMKMIVLNLK